MLDSLVNFLTDSDLNFPEEISRGGDMLVLISDKQEEQHCVFTVPGDAHRSQGIPAWRLSRA